jgi:hypothetical protein
MTFTQVPSIWSKELEAVYKRELCFFRSFQSILCELKRLSTRYQFINPSFYLPRDDPLRFLSLIAFLIAAEEAKSV